jgi:hypothetical protein
MKIDEEWVRKFGDEGTFALETTVLFGESIKVEPVVRQSAWVGGREFRGETWYEFREAAQRIARVAQFNGQRRSDQCQNMEAATAFSMIWSTVNGGNHPYFFECLSAVRLSSPLIPLSENRLFCAAIGTIDYRLRLLYAEDQCFTLNPVEVELTINDFEIPLAETMRFLESVAKLYEYDWRDVLSQDYRAHW